MIDANESSWLHIKAVCTERMEMRKKRLTGKDVDFETTQYIRGEINAFRLILELDQYKKPEKIELEDYK